MDLQAEGIDTEPGGAAITVVVVSEVRLYREGLFLLLARDPRIDVIGAAATHRQAAPLLQCAPDVVLLDAPLANAELALAELGAPAQKVVVLGVREQESDVIAWAEAGAAGYVSREGSADDLGAALEAAAAGETVASPRMVAALLRRLNAVAHGTAAHGLDAAATLTPREQQVARLVGEGLSNKEIAARLCIEVPTVKNHVHNILRKLDVPGRGQAAAYLRAGR
ncbi:MAG TPA: response regulator transcription factor [Gaiellaceae bacterium]|nr:response regulator transcription factor [Gaiellaceae bacterium]